MTHISFFCNFHLAVIGFETKSLILREECRLRVFENKVVRRVSGTEEDGGN
jgi:hypothetical protein